MNSLESKIIRLLQENARYSVEELAVMTGSDASAVQSVMTGLEQKGVILKYTAVINGEMLDEDSVSALIEVKVTPRARSGFDAIAQEIASFEEVKAVYLMSGTYDLSIVLEEKTMRQISAFVSEKLSSIECVTGTATHFIMKHYKDHGVTMNGSFAQKRVSPFAE